VFAFNSPLGENKIKNISFVAMEKLSNKDLFIPVIILVILIVICLWKVSSALWFNDQTHLIAASVVLVLCIIGIIWMTVFIRRNRKAK
jgi:hypothetical protein